MVYFYNFSADLDAAVELTRVSFFVHATKGNLSLVPCEKIVLPFKTTLGAVAALPRCCPGICRKQS